MPQETPTALRFTRIRLENWRNFRHAEVDLQGRVFLVGPNAVGKSNFLDAFRFLHDIARHLGFEQAVLHRGGISRLRNWSAPEDSDVAVAVWIGTDDQPSLWNYEVRFREDAAGRPLLLAERVLREDSEILARPDEEDRQDPVRLTQTALEQSSFNKPFREIAELPVHGFLPPYRPPTRPRAGSLCRQNRGPIRWRFPGTDGGSPAGSASEAAGLGYQSSASGRASDRGAQARTQRSQAGSPSGAVQGQRSMADGGRLLRRHPPTYWVALVVPGSALGTADPGRTRALPASRSRPPPPPALCSDGEPGWPAGSVKHPLSRASSWTRGLGWTRSFS